MLPFTTYRIPNEPKIQTRPNKKWLHLVLTSAPTPSEMILLQKIGMALQADFDRDVSSFVFDPLAEIGMESITSPDTKLLMSFGVPPAEFGLWIDLTSPGIRFLESFTFIMSAPLVELEKNAAAKKELWKYMQHFLEASRQA